MVSTPIVREGWLYIAILTVITVAVFYFSPLLSIIPALLLVFVAYFFRNPARNVPQNRRWILSPADGTVLSVSRVEENHFIKGEAIKVSIFLSLFNVHINRSPIAGEIKYQQYTAGGFLPADDPDAPAENERHALGIENPLVKVMVIQIAGYIARRIVSWVKLGDTLRQGQRYGLIKFGSCTEIIVPKYVEILVRKGDKVKGGETIIGRLR